jgi:hypothetical protein
MDSLHRGTFSERETDGGLKLIFVNSYTSNPPLCNFRLYSSDAKI